MRNTILLAMLVNSSAIAASYGYMIPLAEGNHWIYRYNYHTSNSFYLNPGRSTYDTTNKIGLVKISVDSLLNRNDSIFFTLTTIDSGQTVSKTIDSESRVTTDSFGFYHHQSNRFLHTNDSNFILDSLGQWTQTGWQWLAKTEPMSATIDTNWDLIDPTGQPVHSNNLDLNTLPWFLNYLGPTNHTFMFHNHVVAAGDIDIEIRRHSDSLYPAIINGINYWCYRTGIEDSEFHRGGVSSQRTMTNSNYQWIQNIGYGFYSEDINALCYCTNKIENSWNANWTLLSFNDNPVTLPSKVIYANSKQNLKSNRPTPYRKVFLLEGRHQPLNSSPSGIYNIRGQQLGKIQRSQIIILKDR